MARPKCILCLAGSNAVRTLYSQEVTALFETGAIDAATRDAIEMSRTGGTPPKAHKTGPCRTLINNAVNTVRSIRELAAAAAAHAAAEEKTRTAEKLAVNSEGWFYLILESLNFFGVNLWLSSDRYRRLWYLCHAVLHVVQVWRPLPSMATTTMTTPYPTVSLRHKACPCGMPLRAPLLPRS